MKAVPARHFAVKKEKPAGRRALDLSQRDSKGNAMVSLFDSIRKPKPTDKDSIPLIINSLMHRSNDGIVKIAPGIAKRILEETNFEGQRPIRQARVNEHVSRLRSGRWHSSFAISFAVLPDGAFVLVDGQHRLSAIVEFDSPVPVRVLLHKADSEEDARSLYIGFDASTSVRTTGEVLDAVQLGHDLSIKKIVRNAIYRALALLNNDFEQARSNMLSCSPAVSLDVRIDLFKEWSVQAAQWNEIYAVAMRSHARNLLTSGATAVGLYTLKYQPAKAREFWRGVALNDGLKKLDPRHTLIGDFHTRALNSGSARQTVQSPVLAWNAFYENRPLKIIKCIEGAEIRIAGTPFANGPLGGK